MNKIQRKFLKELVEAPSPTGTEEQVAQLVREHLSVVADEIQTDTMGSVHAILKGIVELSEDEARAAAELNGQNISFDFEYDDSYNAGEDIVLDSAEGIVDGSEFVYSRGNAPTLMLAAHMDEVGLMVTYISDDGFCSVAAVGGVDAAILPGMRVDVHTKEGVLRGVVGRKPIHLIEADERKEVTPLDKLVIDLGMGGDEVRKRVRIGDTITYGVGFERFGEGMAVSKSFDDRSGVYVACRVMEELFEDRPEATFIAAITVQEEIGTRGAITSAHSVNPDVAIAFDVTHATDYPGIDATKYGKIVCGGGPVIARGPNINPFVYERLVAAAEAEGIDYQLEAEPSTTGTDARSIQISQGGIPTGLISIPLRYMHTPTEVINLEDLEGAVRIIVRFARDLGMDASFIPGISPEIEHPFEGNVNRPKKTDADRIKELKREIKSLKSKLASVKKNVSTLAAESLLAAQATKDTEKEQAISSDDADIHQEEKRGEDAVEDRSGETTSQSKDAFSETSGMSSGWHNPRFQSGLGQQGIYQNGMQPTPNLYPHPGSGLGAQGGFQGASSPSEGYTNMPTYPQSSVPFAPTINQRDQQPHGSEIPATMTPQSVMDAVDSRDRASVEAGGFDEALPAISSGFEADSGFNILPIIGPAGEQEE